MSTAPGPGRAQVVGTGLLGGSVGLALRGAGWHVTGIDTDPEIEARAVELGAIDATGWDPAADITFVATPVRAVVAAAREALERTSGVVTDLGSVKASIAAAVDDPRFVGGHPMAGSEQLGIEGSDGDLFGGAVWVLTPTPTTDPDRFATVDAVVRSLGAEVVAVVSHVPHLTAAALMTLADQRASEHAALLRLAAGGFRDMTRVAAGTPTIWPDICAENRTAIVDVIDQLRSELDRMRALVEDGDGDQLLGVLERAQGARRNLPGRVVHPSAVAEVRVPVLDRGGVIAEVSTLAAELGVNIADLEIAHSSEGDRGVLILLVERERAETLRAGLVDRGYHPTVTELR